jgi:hypothetical protein
MRLRCAERQGIGDSEDSISHYETLSNFCYWTEFFQRSQPLQIGSGHYRSKLGTRLDNVKLGPCNNNNNVNSREYANPTISFYRQLPKHFRTHYLLHGNQSKYKLL